MHFWIDKRSSQLHQYGGGGRRGQPGGFYSQNFGMHRNSPSIVQPPRRLRIRANNSSSGTALSTNNSAGSSTNTNINAHTHSSNSNNNFNTPIANGNPPSTSIALHHPAAHYPHQQPHQIHQQSTTMSPVGGVPFPSTNRSSGSIAGVGGDTTIRLIHGTRNNDALAFRSINGYTTQQQAPLGDGILAISGAPNAIISTATLNPPMSFVTADEEGGTLSSTTVLTFPPTAAASAPAGTLRNGADSWRNPHHIPSGSRTRTYSRDNSLPGFTVSATATRGSRDRRTSSNSSWIGRNSIGNGVSMGSSTPDGPSDRRADRRETLQHSHSLTSAEAGEQSSRETSTGGRPSLETDPGWACTKRIGLTLCFLAFILLGTVGAKFMIQGPEVLDGSRTGKPEAAAYFLFTELVFVAFAMFLFFTGVACLRKRTNDYLLRQFNQYILNTSANSAASGGGLGRISSDDAFDFDYYEPSLGENSTNHHAPITHHHYRHHRNGNSMVEQGGFGSIGDISHSPHNFHGVGNYHYPAHGGSTSSRHGRSKPPPYDIAILLPLPDPMGTYSPTQNNKINGQSESAKLNTKVGGMNDEEMGLIASSSVKDTQDEIGNATNSTTGVNDNQVSSTTTGDEDNGKSDREEERCTETPPPPYEQI